MCATVVFGIVIYPLLTCAREVASKVGSDPTRQAVWGEISIVVFVEVHVRGLGNLQTRGEEIVAVFGAEVTWTGAKGESL